jgi:hypothetical protein
MLFELISEMQWLSNSSDEKGWGLGVLGVGNKPYKDTVLESHIGVVCAYSDRVDDR